MGFPYDKGVEGTMLCNALLPWHAFFSKSVPGAVGFVSLNTNPDRSPNLRGVSQLWLTSCSRMGVQDEKGVEQAILVQCLAHLGMPES